MLAGSTEMGTRRGSSVVPSRTPSVRLSNQALTLLLACAVVDIGNVDVVIVLKFIHLVRLVISEKSEGALGVPVVGVHGSGDEDTIGMAGGEHGELDLINLLE